MITRNSWSPTSTPPPSMTPGSVQVNTNGRGAVVWLVPREAASRAAVPAHGAPVLGMRKPKLMMDPRDPSTWQRPYRFTS